MDTTFVQAANGFNNFVHSLAVHLSNNSLYIGGDFTQYRGVASNARRLAKVDLVSGNLDTTFTVAGSGLDNVAYALAVANGSLYVGGSFNNYRGVAGAAMYLAKVDLTSGNLDTTFTQASNGFDGSVESLFVNSSSNSIYVGGSFTQYRGTADNAHRLAKLDLTSGNLDTTFTQAGRAFGTNAVVHTLSESANRTLYVGGTFTHYRGTASNGSLSFQSTIDRRRL